MVEVIFHLVIFWKTQQVAMLHIHKIFRLCEKKTYLNTDFIQFINSMSHNVVERQFEKR